MVVSMGSTGLYLAKLCPDHPVIRLTGSGLQRGHSISNYGKEVKKDCGGNYTNRSFIRQWSHERDRVVKKYEEKGPLGKS